MKNYDKRVKQTRILLADYIIIKGFSRQAGLSMAEALHKLLILVPEAQPKAVLKVPIARAALGYASQSAIATNGSKVAAFGVMPKGARYDD